MIWVDKAYEKSRRMKVTPFVDVRISGTSKRFYGTPTFTGYEEVGILRRGEGRRKRSEREPAKLPDQTDRQERVSGFSGRRVARCCKETECGRDRDLRESIGQSQGARSDPVTPRKTWSCVRVDRGLDTVTVALREQEQ
jgi:hypothetical protein